MKNTVGQRMPSANASHGEVTSRFAEEGASLRGLLTEIVRQARLRAEDGVPEGTAAKRVG